MLDRLAEIHYYATKAYEDSTPENVKRFHASLTPAVIIDLIEAYEDIKADLDWCKDKMERQ